MIFNICIPYKVYCYIASKITIESRYIVRIDIVYKTWLDKNWYNLIKAFRPSYKYTDIYKNIRIYDGVSKTACNVKVRNICNILTYTGSYE
jgi:hypothetical protein